MMPLAQRRNIAFILYGDPARWSSTFLNLQDYKLICFSVICLSAIDVLSPFGFAFQVLVKGTEEQHRPWIPLKPTTYHYVLFAALHRCIMA
jgi:hypothetical protein